MHEAARIEYRKLIYSHIYVKLVMHTIHIL